MIVDMNTGLRRSEILAIQRSNIDRNNRLIILDKTESNERKIVPMNRTVWDVIQSLPPRVNTTYLFFESDGNPIEPDKVTVAFKRACNKARIKDFRLHDLRLPLCLVPHDEGTRSANCPGTARPQRPQNDDALLPAFI